MVNWISGVFVSSFERAPWGWGLLAGIVYLWVKMRPDMTKLGMDREDKLGERIADLEKRVDDAARTAHLAEMKLTYAVSAVHLLATTIRAEMPDHPSLAQAMELLKAAVDGGMPDWSAKLVGNLNSVRGVGE